MARCLRSLGIPLEGTRLIPNRLILVYIPGLGGDTQAYADMRRCESAFQKLNPLWEVMIYTTCPEIKKQDNVTYLPSFEKTHPNRRPVFPMERFKHPVELSNVIRLVALHQHGGLYCDNDVDWKRPIDDTFFGNSGRLPLFSGEAGETGASVIAASRNDSFLGRCIKSLKPALKKDREDHRAIFRANGTELISSLLDSEPGGRAAYTLPESSVVRVERQTGKEYAVHVHRAGWKLNADP